MSVKVKPDKRNPATRWLVKWNYEDMEWTQTCKPEGRRTAEKVARALADTIRRRIDLVKCGDLPIPDDALKNRKALKAFLMNGMGKLPKRVETEATIQKIVDDYLEERKLKADSGGLSTASYRSDVNRLNNFLAYCKGKGQAKRSGDLTETFLRRYRSYFLKRVADGKASPADAKHHLRIVKTMVLWAYKQKLVKELPRNLDGEYASVKQPKPQVEVFTVDELKELYGLADDRQKLWILLGLNCGYTQTDIASLTHDMVDWSNDLIRRDRQKTGVQSEHKLWPTTLTLLKNQATDPNQHDLLLLNSKGNPLIQNNTDRNPTCTITQSMRRLLRNADTSLTFKYLRKTGASLIEEKYQDKPWLASLYLSHEIAGVIRKHYTHQSFDGLHEATEWLRQHLDLEAATHSASPATVPLPRVG